MITTSSQNFNVAIPPLSVFYGPLSEGDRKTLKVIHEMQHGLNTAAEMVKKGECKLEELRAAAKDVFLTDVYPMVMHGCQASRYTALSVLKTFHHHRKLLKLDTEVYGSSFALAWNFECDRKASLEAYKQEPTIEMMGKYHTALVGGYIARQFCDVFYSEEQPSCFSAEKRLKIITMEDSLWSTMILKPMSNSDITRAILLKTRAQASLSL
ncbi:MAG: hypothetical protein FWF24_06185 [Alphaproteobacteria bacterium]|nr:hypothetical protein [Alphaproteobacteria bacterium]